MVSTKLISYRCAGNTASLVLECDLRVSWGRSLRPVAGAGVAITLASLRIPAAGLEVAHGWCEVGCGGC